MQNIIEDRLCMGAEVQLARVSTTQELALDIWTEPHTCQKMHMGDKETLAKPPQTGISYIRTPNEGRYYGHQSQCSLSRNQILHFQLDLGSRRRCRSQEEQPKQQSPLE